MVGWWFNSSAWTLWLHKVVDMSVYVRLQITITSCEDASTHPAITPATLWRVQLPSEMTERSSHLSLVSALSRNFYANVAQHDCSLRLSPTLLEQLKLSSCCFQVGWRNSLPQQEDAKQYCMDSSCQQRYANNTVLCDHYCYPGSAEDKTESTAGVNR